MLEKHATGRKHDVSEHVIPKDRHLHEAIAFQGVREDIPKHKKKRRGDGGDVPVADRLVESGGKNIEHGRDAAVSQLPIGSLKKKKLPRLELCVAVAKKRESQTQTSYWPVRLRKMGRWEGNECPCRLV